MKKSSGSNERKNQRKRAKESGRSNQCRQAGFTGCYCGAGISGVLSLLFQISSECRILFSCP
jgi:hypothetical protein